MLYHYSAVPLEYGSILEVGVRKIKPGERDTVDWKLKTDARLCSLMIVC